MSPPHKPSEPHPPWVPPEKKPAWPTVIGVISIVFAGWGLVCAPLFIVINLLNPRIIDSAPEWYGTYVIIHAFFGILLAVIHLIGGITLLKRRPASMTLLLTYACLAVVSGLIACVITFITAGSMPAAFQAGRRVGAFVGLLFGMAYPVFLLIWFSRTKIKQQVRQW